MKNSPSRRSSKQAAKRLLRAFKMALQTIGFRFSMALKGKKGELKRTVTFKGSIPLYKVAVLANTVHFSEKTYILNSSNCYFYATTVMQVIEKVYGKEIEKSTNSNTSSTMPGTVPFLNRISLPKLYHQTKIDRNTFQRISDRYQSNLETFEAKACSSSLTEIKLAYVDLNYLGTEQG